MHVSMLCAALQLDKQEPLNKRDRSRRLSAESIRLLQERVNSKTPDCISDTTLCSIAALTNIENSRGNLRNAHMHLAGLKRILDIRGGLHPVRDSHATIANIIFCAFISAADENFPVHDIRRPIVRPEWFWKALNEDNAEGRLDLEAHGLRADFCEIMLNLRMLAKTFPTGQSCSTASEYQAILTFLSATLQRMISLPIPQSVDLYEDRITIACRHAMIVHVFADWCGHDPDPHLLVNMAQHKLLLAVKTLVEHNVSNILLLWLLSVGATVRQSRAEKKWFIGQLVNVTADLGISTWVQYRSNLQQVIWHGHSDERMHGLVWKEVEMRRSDEQIQ
jgi:hypothetical protein